jgi:membrane peptidoglycan carboxypeptidase
LRYALANSFNIPAVKTVQAFGVPNFVNYAQRMGITTWQDPSKYGLSIALGGAEVHMTDAATAYGVFANQGYKVPVTGISQIDDAYGNELYTLSPTKTRVMNPGVAYIMSDILSDPFARVMEFGTNSALEIPGIKASVKTGTTDNKKDNWADGYTPDFVVIVWVGNNDNTPMNQALASGITGAAPIWHRMMEYLVRTYGNPNKWYDMPNDVVAKTCYFGKQEYFLRGTENSANCSGPKPTQPPVANITGVNTLTNSNGPVYRSVQ